MLKDLKTVKWRLFRDEIDFHVHTVEIVEIKWSIEALRVHVIMNNEAGELSADRKPRGDVVTSFPRARTMCRFLFFCRERGVRLDKKFSPCDGTIASRELTHVSEEINDLWVSMVSEQLPAPGDSDQLLVE